MKHPEILAPAGSMESLTAALRCGADAVYVGGKKYSARSNAVNFSAEELEEAAYLCHIHGAKLYLAVNTVISDDELADFCEYIRQTAKAGVDAYIVQDIGAAEVIRAAVPDAVLHASTQMSVHTAAGAEMVKNLGFARVVPARELSSDTLKKISAVDIETEVFVHGALCMSVSGQCYMSAMIGSRSANRGCCGQACRLPFSASGRRDCTALSLKDLSLLEKTDILCDAGIDSLKIEGRMKRPEYIAAAVTELKNALDGKSPDMQLLRDIFSRDGFTDGYFSGRRQNMFGRREKDDVLAAKDVIPKLHELYRSERKAFRADFYCEIMPDKPVLIKAECSGISVQTEGDCPDSAKSTPVNEEAVAKQLSRLGDTVFECGNIRTEIGEGLFVSAGKLNELRRNTIQLLTEKLAENLKPKYSITGFVPKISGNPVASRTEELPVRAFCRTAEQAAAAAKSAEFVVIPEKIVTDELIRKINADKIIVSPPRFITDEEKTISRLEGLKNLGISRLLCNTPDLAAEGQRLGFKIHGSFTMNLFNSPAADALSDIGFEDCIISPEMTLSQLENLRTDLPLGAVVYGRLPLMLTRNCPIKNEIGCDKCTGCLVDRTSRRLPVACSKDYVEILNSDILYMGDRLPEMKNLSFTVVLLNEENAAQTAEAMNFRRPDGNITRGLYYRGVCES